MDHLGPAGASQRGILVCDDPASEELRVATYRYFKDIERDNLIEIGSPGYEKSHSPGAGLLVELALQRDPLQRLRDRSARLLQRNSGV